MPRSARARALLTITAAVALAAAPLTNDAPRLPDAAASARAVDTGRVPQAPGLCDLMNGHFPEKEAAPGRPVNLTVPDHVAALNPTIEPVERIHTDKPVFLNEHIPPAPPPVDMPAAAQGDPCKPPAPPAWSVTSNTATFPDTNIAMGSTKYVVVYTDKIAWGTKGAGLTTTMANETLLYNNGFRQGSVYDPTIRWTPVSGGHFVFVGGQGQSSSNARTVVAVSKTADPAGAWWVYSFNGNIDTYAAHNTQRGSDHWGLNVTSDKIIVTSDGFTDPSYTIGIDILPLGAAIAGTLPTNLDGVPQTQHQTIRNVKYEYLAAAQGLAAAASNDPVGRYASLNRTNGMLSRFDIAGATGSATVSQYLIATEPSYDYLGTGYEMHTPGPAGSDYKVYVGNTVLDAGYIQNANGTKIMYMTGITKCGTQICVWADKYDITFNNFSPALFSTTGASLIVPSVVTTTAGSLIMFCTYVSTSYSPGAAAVSSGFPLTVYAGAQNNWPSTTTQPDRWGDYSHGAMDPANGGHVYGIAGRLRGSSNEGIAVHATATGVLSGF